MTAVVISLLAIVSKVLGCGLPMLLDGIKTATKIGVGMLPRGEVALIVALIGLQTKAISQRSYAVVIFMTAVTTLIAPPLLRYLFRQTQPSPAPDLMEDELGDTSLG